MITWYMAVNQETGGVAVEFDPRDWSSTIGAVVSAEYMLDEKVGLEADREWTVMAYLPHEVAVVEPKKNSLNYPIREWLFPDAVI